jgi:hypothetical protein
MPPTITGHAMSLLGSGNPQKPRFRRERPHPRPAVPFINELGTQETRSLSGKGACLAVRAEMLRGEARAE